jgi:hypothetical protein
MHDAGYRMQEGKASLTLNPVFVSTKKNIEL